MKRNGSEMMGSRIQIRMQELSNHPRIKKKRKKNLNLENQDGEEDQNRMFSD